MSDPDENYSVEEAELNDFELGFITGVLAARGFKEPTDSQFRDALALLIAHSRDIDG